MNKEAILEKLQKENPSSIPVFKAMDEYAKQQAIAFDIWKRENCITYDYDNNSYNKLIFLDVEHTKVRTEQISTDDAYNQFIEQQNK